MTSDAEEALSPEALRQELLETMARELAALEESHRQTRAGATHEEAKPENDKDTRALEQSYLARGQAQRVAELRAAMQQVRSVQLGGSTRAALGCCVTVRVWAEPARRTGEHLFEPARRTGEPNQGEHLFEPARSFFLMPGGGGTRLHRAAREVLVVTPQSPWGRALVGAVVGEVRSARIGDHEREFEVLSVQ